MRCFLFLFWALVLLQDVRELQQLPAKVGLDCLHSRVSQGGAFESVVGVLVVASGRSRFTDVACK